MADIEYKSKNFSITITSKQIAQFRRLLGDTSDTAKCWEWQGGRTKGPKSSGYGRFRVTRHCKKYTIPAHRLAYVLHYSKQPDTLFVCHKCDNPSCCNPYHLELGTAKENMAEAGRRGRMNPPKGVKHHRAKLNDQAIRLIRFAHTNGFSTWTLAEIFNVSRTQIRHIVNNRGWSHVA